MLSFRKKLIAHKIQFSFRLFFRLCRWLLLIVWRVDDEIGDGVDVVVTLVNQSCLSLVEAVAAYLYGRSN